MRGKNGLVVDPATRCTAQGPPFSLSRIEPAAVPPSLVIRVRKATRNPSIVIRERPLPRKEERNRNRQLRTHTHADRRSGNRPHTPQPTSRRPPQLPPPQLGGRRSTRRPVVWSRWTAHPVARRPQRHFADAACECGYELKSISSC